MFHLQAEAKKRRGRHPTAHAHHVRLLSASASGSNLIRNAPHHSMILQHHIQIVRTFVEVTVLVVSSVLNLVTMEIDVTVVWLT
jgi:hypothetical protein